MAGGLHHHLLRMGGRDPHEDGRTATPLELLFDLAFVIAFGAAADELAHALAEDHVATGLLSFAFLTFGITWAWINFSWFASAYDTDDWIFRLLTMVQMAGVLIFALGIPDVFASVEAGDTVDNGLLVVGYVVMRVALVAQWLRASRQDPSRRRACLTYAGVVTLAQIGWVVLLVADTTVAETFAWVGVLLLVELLGPVLAETRDGGTPWHAHHMAERHALLVIIALGEGLLGIMVALSALVGPDGPGWSTDAVALTVAGIVMIFGMWWIYFIVPSGEILHAHRERAFGWGYSHFPLFGSLVAVGAGLHVAAYLIEGESALDVTGVVLTVAAPLTLYILVIFGLYSLVTRSLHAFHALLLVLSAAVLAAGVALAVSGAGLAWSLVVLALAPWVTVVGYEVHGHRHNAEVLAGLR